MRGVRRPAALLLGLLLVMACAVCFKIPAAVFADTEEAAAEPDEPYTFTVTVYAGKEGHFDGEDPHMVRISGIHYAEDLMLDMEQMGLTVNEPDKYYARGFKLSGHDNDEAGERIHTSLYIPSVTSDQSYAVAYGMAGGMVKYTVHYEDANGEELLAPHEYYGMAGDKPVVSYRYIEGYLPNAYNLGKTLTDNEEENVFTFTYTKTETEDASQQGGQDEGEAAGSDAADAANGNAAGANGAGGTGGAAYAGADGAAGQNAPADYVDLDEDELPLAGADNEAGQEEQPDPDAKSAAVFKWVFAGLGGAAGIGLLGWLLALLKRRRAGGAE